MGFLPQAVAEEADRLLAGGVPETTVKVLHGEEMFVGEAADYPREWNDFVGQREAKEELQVKVLAAKNRGSRLEHILLESGVHGIGKTTLAYLVAYHLGRGLVVAGAPMTPEHFVRITGAMSDGDILFVDEIHRQMIGGTAKSDWLLPWMLGGGVQTSFGMRRTPDVTLVAATTEAGRLPATMLSRFMTTPQLGPYSADEAADIAGANAARMGVQLDEKHWPLVAEAADRNPRAMRKILTQIRDLYEVAPASHPNLERALSYAGFSPDGLTVVARQMLLVLASRPSHTMSIDNIKDTLGEPATLRHHEQILKQHGLIEIVPQGRKLTAAGVRRAAQEVARG